MTEAKYIIGKARISFGEITDTSATLDKLYPTDLGPLDLGDEKFTMTGTFKMTPEFENLVRSWRRAEFYRWLSRRPILRGVGMSVSVDTLISAGAIR